MCNEIIIILYKQRTNLRRYARLSFLQEAFLRACTCRAWVRTPANVNNNSDLSYGMSETVPGNIAQQFMSNERMLCLRMG